MTWRELQDGLAWRPPRDGAWRFGVEAAVETALLPVAVLVGQLMRLAAWIAHRPHAPNRLGPTRDTGRVLDARRPPPVHWILRQQAWLWIAEGVWRLLPSRLLGGPQAVASMAQQLTAAWGLMRISTMQAGFGRIYRAELRRAREEVRKVAREAAALRALDAGVSPPPFVDTPERLCRRLASRLASYGGRDAFECGSMAEAVLLAGPLKAAILEHCLRRQRKETSADELWQMARAIGQAAHAEVRPGEGSLVPAVVRIFDRSQISPGTRDMLWPKLEQLGFAPRPSRVTARRLRLPGPAGQDATTPPERPQGASHRRPMLEGLELHVRALDGGGWAAEGPGGEPIDCRVEEVVFDRLLQPPDWVAWLQAAGRPWICRVAGGRLACGHPLHEGVPIEGRRPGGIGCSRCAWQGTIQATKGGLR